MWPTWSLPSRGRGAFGVDGEHPPRPQDPCHQLQSEHRPATIAAVDRDHAERREQPAGLPALEVLGLAHEAERAASGHEQHDRIEERDVVRGNDHGPAAGQVLAALHPDTPQEVVQRRDEQPSQRIARAELSAGPWRNGCLDARAVCARRRPCHDEAARPESHQSDRGATALTCNGTARDGAVPLDLGRVGHSAMEPAVTGLSHGRPWVISTLRGLASSATGMVSVSTPFS